MKSTLIVSFLVLLSIQNTLAAPAFIEFNFSPELDQTAPKPKTRAEHFNDIGLKLSRLDPVLSTSNCYQKPDKLMGCLNAVNALLYILSENTIALSAKETLSKKFEKLIFTKTKDFGAISIYQYEAKPGPLASEFSMAKYVKSVQENQKEVAANTLELYQSKNKIPFETLLNWIKTSVIAEKNTNESLATAQALNSYLDIVYDPHTSLEPMKFWEELSNTSETSFYGIGIQYLNNQDDVIIKTPFRGSPALKAGIKAKDQIIAVNGVTITKENKQKVVDEIKGPQGTTVRITVKRGEEILDFDVIRDKITRKNVDYFVVNDLNQKPYGYLMLNDFTSKIACEEVYSALLAFDKQKVSGLIFDLRQNGGGSLEIGVCISTLFIGSKKLVVKRKSLLPGVPDEKEVSGINPYIHKKINPRYVSTLPMVTLIDSGSASASEIVAGALQDYQRSLVVGERSYGKATVQTIIPYFQLPRMYDPFSPSVLASGEKADPKGKENEAREFLSEEEFIQDSKLGLKLTMQRFYLPSGRTNQIVGITPEVEAYDSPYPTEDDKAALREGDEYSSLPAVGAAYQDPRPGYTARVLNCLKAQAAQKAYEQKQNDALAPDYPVLVGQETLGCMIN